MVWMNEKKVKALEFVFSNTELFDEYELQYILHYVRANYDDLFLPDIIRELYDWFEIIPDSQNIYLGFLDLLKENFNISNSHIIEVGGGILPCLGRKISLMQDRGSITVYDPRLSFYEKNNSHMRLVRDSFSVDTNIQDTNLLIGFKPCKGAEALVKSAITHNVDFMVALCEGGLHGDIYDYFDSDEEWIDSILYLASRGVEDHSMGSLQIDYLKKYGDPYPVIYNKR